MRHHRTAILLALVIATLPACRQRTTTRPQQGVLNGKLVLFHAGSLAVPLAQISAAFQSEHPGIVVEAEAAGSRDSARKISDLGRPCDVLASADYRVVADLLIPKHADYNIRFATNEMAIAYTPKSRLADKVTTANWPEILLSPDVAYGRADPDRDPCGYRTVILLQLAEKHYGLPKLADRLLDKDRRFIRPKETDLLGLLESGEIDYVFIYRSVIQQHRLQMVALPPEVNLSSPDMEARYATAATTISGSKPGETIVQRGEAIVYSLTIPRGAPNRAAAEAYVSLLLSPRGQQILRDNGQAPIQPALVDGYHKLPDSLKPMCRPVK